MLAIRGGKVLTVTQGTVDEGTVLIEDGKIKAVGRDLEVPADAEVIDAGGKYVLPGFIDAHAHVAIWEEGHGWEGNDVNELTDPVTPHLRAVDAINPADEGLRDALSAGVTAIWSAPGSGNVIGGQGVVVRTAGRTVEEMVVKEPAGVKAAFGENPKRVYTERKKMPTTRMGIAAVMRTALVKAQNYMAKLERAGDDPEKRPERDLAMEALVKVLRREMPLRTHAHRADDILTALRIADEFGIDMTIEHCTEGHKIADILAEKGVKVVVGPTITARVKVELKDRTLKTPAVLARAGVQVSLMTDHPVIPIQYLPLIAGLAVREGMPEEEALRAITINAADICGVADRLGSLEAGKDADLVIYDGHPFETRSRALMTFVRGRLVYEYRGE